MQSYVEMRQNLFRIIEEHDVAKTYSSNIRHVPVSGMLSLNTSDTSVFLKTDANIQGCISLQGTGILLNTLEVGL